MKRELLELSRALLPDPSPNTASREAGPTLQAGRATPTHGSQPEPSEVDAAAPETEEDLGTPPSGLHPHLDVFDHVDMTEYYLHTEVFYQFVSTGDPRAADAAPPVQETNEEDTAPLARTGKTAQNAEAPLEAANNENDAPSTIQDLPNVEPYYQVDEQETEEPNTAADNQNTIQHVPNSVPYYQNDVQETEEPDWGTGLRERGECPPTRKLGRQARSRRQQQSHSCSKPWRPFRPRTGICCASWTTTPI